MISILLRILDLVLTFTPLRNIAFSLMHLLAYSKFVGNHQFAIDIVSTVAWQNVSLSYSLISSTTPLLKGFTQGFMTAGLSLVRVPEATTNEDSQTNRSHELRSLPSLSAGSKACSQDLPMSRFRTASLQGNPKKRSKKLNLVASNSSECQLDESASLASHDSRSIMIKREWEISANHSN